MSFLCCCLFVHSENGLEKILLFRDCYQQGPFLTIISEFLVKSHLSLLQTEDVGNFPIEMEFLWDLIVDH